MKSQSPPEKIYKASALEVPAGVPAMPKEAAFAMKREFVQNQRQACEHDNFPEQKVQTARTTIQAGLCTPDEVVEEQFLARRAKVAGLL